MKLPHQKQQSECEDTSSSPQDEMLFLTLASLILCLATSSTAFPSLPKRAANDTTAVTATAANMTNNCGAATILSIGIAMNIVDQRNEQLALAQVKSVLSTTPVDMAAFAAAKTNLLTFVNNGITIRQMNQAIMPAGNAATDGLITVSKAQLAELNLAQGLTGNPAVDLQAVATMETDFAGGIVQNMMNQQAATAGCPMSAMMASSSTAAGAGTSMPATGATKVVTGSTL